MIEPSGTLTRIAGVGSAGFSGDGGPAPEAELNFPTGLTLDAAGDLFISDSFNNRIRMVDPSGVIIIDCRHGHGRTRVSAVPPSTPSSTHLPDWTD